MKLQHLLFACIMFFSLLPHDTAAAKLVLLKDAFPGSSQRFYSALKSELVAHGLGADEVAGTALAARLATETGSGTILVLSNACCYPVEAKPALEEFLKRGNHLLAISGPAFGSMVHNEGGRWLTQELAKNELLRVPGTQVIDFAKQDMKAWTRSSDSMNSPTEYRVEPSGDSRVPSALHVKIGKLGSWDTLVSPALPSPYPTCSDATAFWAKGAGTPELAVEAREKDGSRWMGVVKLTPEWKRYVLTPRDFAYWPDNPSKGRGGHGDRFNPANLDAISIGIAAGITNQPAGQAYEYWISDIRAVADQHAQLDYAPPVLDSLSPAYKTYRTTASRLSTGVSAPQGLQITSPIWRGPGFGSDAPRAYRYVPTVRALSEEGELRGSAAHLFINAKSGYPGSVWGFIGFDQESLEKDPKLALPAAVDMLERMSRGLFLVNAGADRIACPEGEATRLGAYALNLTDKPVSAEVRFAIREKEAAVHSFIRAVELAPSSGGEPAYIAGESITLPAGEYVSSVTLMFEGKPVDGITYPFRVIRFEDPGPEDTVTVRDGDFYLGGARWYGLGMNYWPTYTNGQENWVPWLEPEQYNPEIIERDLTLARKLGINLLSIQYTTKSQAAPMMDFLARAHSHGIKVHAYMPGLHPLDHSPKLAESLIKAAHLDKSPAFFSYDLGWEVNVGPYERRKNHDKLWQEWVIDRYGSIENAEADWGFKPDRVGGVLTGPTYDHVMNDGPWRVYVAAYRRFWDDEISARYRKVREFVRSLDRHHLIGCRSGYGGTGSTWAAQFFPFDLASGAKHLDYTSPEAYALGGDRLGYLKGGLITLYGRFVSGGKPVFWCEYGTSIWPQCDAAALERARQCYDYLLDMTYRSRANASAGWWWPGGFRLGENSDFGIVSPDGTPRPAALQIRTFSERLRTLPQERKPDTLLSFDRDKHVTGFAGVYESLADQYVKLIEEGKWPGLKTSGTGTTSANTPAVAVGNVPWNGHNPPKYLNAEFNWVRINGEIASDDSVIEVAPGKPVYLEASVGNIGEAMWLSPRNATKGAVYVAVDSDRYGRSLCPIAADTPFLADASVKKHMILQPLEGQVTITLRMTARDRTDFGEVVRVTLKPKGQ